MHPINNKNFGAGKVKVYFYDGSAVTTGHVVKQIGTKRYVVSNGTVTKTVSLAPTAALAKRLDGTSAVGTKAEITDLCTMRITVGSVTNYVFKLSSVAADTDGGTFAWTLGTPAGTVYGIDIDTPPAPEPAPVQGG
jgi:hypothetical protein